MHKWIQCIPNFSEGRDTEKIEQILDVFRGKKGLKLLDYSSDIDHNRSVVTLLGEPEVLKEAMVEAIGVAIEVIDMRKHKGQHPRMGCVDVIPFVPIKNTTIEEADKLAKDVARIASEKYNYPFFLYEYSATQDNRIRLEHIRKGEFENMVEKMQKDSWKPDYGPQTIHITGGVTAIGAREPLIAYNIKLGTNDLEIANKIAREVRHLNGGLRYCKAMGVELKERGIVEVSMNLTDYKQTKLYQVFEMVKMECARYGVSVLGSEIIGMVPLMALSECATYYLGLEDFDIERIIETHLE